MGAIFSDTDLILNNDGSLYHIHLKNEHIADDVIVVGDPDRVAQISKHFDGIEFKIHNREFVTHTGNIGPKRITVLSTGIGTDNIDIAINELDAAVNIDPDTRMLRAHRRKLNIIRIGTSGTLQEDIPVGTFLISSFGLGFDGVMHYYHYNSDALEAMLEHKIIEHLHLDAALAQPYVCKADAKLLQHLSPGMISGITASAPGFYGPQGRRLKLNPRYPGINEALQSFAFESYRITNFEMETSVLYGLGNLLGHACCTCCAIIANRPKKTFSENYHQIVDDLTTLVLEKIATNQAP